MTKDDLAVISMNVISTAGEAKSLAIEAMRSIKTDGVEKAKELIKQAREKMAEAQEHHFQALSADAAGDEVNIDVLFVHAEDQFLSADTIIILVDEIINLKGNV